MVHVSVIVPTFNRAHSLEGAIRSVLRQGFGDMEVLVVDDASTDGTADLMARLVREDPRIQYLPQAVNRGAAGARNVALPLARGTFVAFQDSDDEWTPGRLVALLAPLEQDPALGFAYGDMVRVTPPGRESPFPAPDLAPGQVLNEGGDDYATVGIGIGATVARSSALQAIGGMDTSLQRFEDMEFLLRLHLRFPSRHVRETVLRYIDYGEGLSSNRAAHAEARLRLMAKYRVRARRFRARQYYQVGLNLAHDRHLLRGAWYLGRSLALGPSQAPRVARALRGGLGHRFSRRA
ncbi:MAG TPA: glycosyltransferase family 2 protein [Candidatus Thermoplasmatota archaeon]|nr:glycosyltransferase family 2 protein [Candidatus Thermoplasmatota archaeon]